MKNKIFTFSLMLLFAASPFFLKGQNKVSKSGFFKSLSLDPVVTLHNKSETDIKCIIITYKIDGKDLQTYNFGGTLPAKTSVDIPLPRMHVSNGMHFFDASVSAKNGKSLKNETFAEGLTFTLSPGTNVLSGTINDGNSNPETDNKSGCSCRNGDGLDEDISFWFNIYIDDHLKLDAFGSTDYGKLWFQGKWDEKAGLENELNRATFIDPSNSNRSFELTVSTESVPENYTDYGITQKETSAFDLNVLKCKAYPNPFSGHVNIEYTVNKKMNIDIIISDISGKIVAQPVHSLPHGIGVYTYDFNTSNLAQGIYWCTIQSGNTKQTVKLIKK